MAKQLDDSEFWLPPQFLTDDDFIAGFKPSKNEENSCSLLDFQPFGLDAAFGTSSNSGLSSPGESMTETESDEDDYITGLTRRMAHSTLEENSYDNKNSKVWDFSGSPKSPLCKPGLSRYSSRYNSVVSTQAALKQNEGAWDLLCAAAGEVARMKMVQESAGVYPNRHGHGVILPPRKPSPVAVPVENLCSNVGFRPNELQFSYQQLQAARFEQLRRQQLMKQQQQGGDGVVWGQGRGGCGHLYQVNLNQQMAQRNGARRTAAAAGLSMSAWPTLQQSQQQPPQPQPQPQPQPGSGMRAMFLGNPSGKRECAGTGVFLPRRIGSPTESRKTKPACSTVLLPDRVVQALNLKLETVDAQPQVQPKFNPTLASDYDAALKYRSNMLMAQQRQQNSLRPQPVMNQEVRLPQEWTY